MSRSRIPCQITKLRGYLAEHRIKPLRIARVYGCTTSYIGAVIRGDKRVRAATLEKIIIAIETIERESNERAA